MTTTVLDNQQIASVITEALPYIQRYRGKTVVVKYGGNAMIDEDLKRAVASDIVLMKLVGMNPILVHGGGPQINATLTERGIESEFRHGMRVTDEAVMEVVEAVLAGEVNEEIVDLINERGGNAVGLSGKHERLILAKKMLGNDEDGQPTVDIGFVGKVERIDGNALMSYCQQDRIPVVAPVGISAAGQSFNINGDSVASAIASALSATNLVVLSNTLGVLDKSGSLITSIDRAGVDALKSDGTIYGGMIPKIDGALQAIEEGVEKVTFIDGRVPHALLLEIFTDRGVGTQITG